MKILTIVVPAYNMEKYLDECLNSLSGRALSDFVEVIVVDDGSTDDTARIALDYAVREPSRFRLIQKKNGGHGSAVNAGLERAEGKYVRVVDADDLADGEGLLHVVGEMRKSSADLIVDERIRFRDGAVPPVKDALPGEVPVGADADFLEAVSEPLLPLLNMHTISARTDFVREIGLVLLENTFYVDFQYAFLLIQAAKSVRFVREAVYRYRVGNEGQSVHYLNYVRRYDHHDRVLKACVKGLAVTEDPRRGALMMRMLKLITHTQYKIALIFHPSAREGRRLARTLRTELLISCASVERRARGRYFMALILNRTGLRRLLLKRIRGYSS